MSDLKACPFCGSDTGPEVWRGQAVGTRDNGYRFIRCTNCGATGTYTEEAEAIAAWNHRAYLALNEKQRAVIEAARKTCKGFVGVSCIKHADNHCDDWCSGCKRGLEAATTLHNAVEALDQEIEEEQC